MWASCTHHGLIGVLLKLNQPNPGDIFQVHVSVGAVRGVSVQVRWSRRGSHPQRLVAVHLVCHHIVGLQQSLDTNTQCWDLQTVTALSCFGWWCALVCLICLYIFSFTLQWGLLRMKIKWSFIFSSMFLSRLLASLFESFIFRYFLSRIDVAHLCSLWHQNL